MDDTDKIKAISNNFTEEFKESVEEQKQNISQELADSGRGFSQELASKRVRDTFKEDRRIRVPLIKNFSEAVKECGNYDDKNEVIACSKVKARESAEELGDEAGLTLGLR